MLRDCLAAWICARYALVVLDLWHYKAGLKEQVGGIAKELQAPRTKLALRAAVGAGRHSIVKQLAASMDAAVVEIPPSMTSMPLSIRWSS